MTGAQAGDPVAVAAGRGATAGASAVTSDSPGGEKQATGGTIVTSGDRTATPGSPG